MARKPIVSMIIKKYLGEAGAQTHFREAGLGPNLIMLHASPMSSAQMVPMITPLSEHFKVIAPDTPGYGNSDPLPAERLDARADLLPYVEWLDGFLDQLKLNQVMLYGTATGAQIAVEAARHVPHRVSGLILDNAAHFEEQERQWILQDYFPSLTPEADGSHLNAVWSIADNLFRYFPWFAQKSDYQISEQSPPPDVVHATALCYLNAGQDYAQAYRRAFLNEDARRVQCLTKPVEIIRWQGSILKKYSDRFDQFDWPSNIRMRHCGASNEARLAAIIDAAKCLSSPG